MSASHKTPSGIWANLGLLFGTLVICAVLSELFLRAFFPQVINLNAGVDLWREDPELEIVLKPNTKNHIRVTNTFDVEVRVNSQGMRADRDYAVEKASGVTRILFLGDSFVFGWGVEQDESLPERLEQTLERRGIRAEVMNAGVYSYNTQQYVLWHRRLQKFKPDIVVLGFCLENDFYVPTPPPAEVEGAAAAEPAAPVASAVTLQTTGARVYHWIKEKILIRSHLLALIRDQLYMQFPDIRKYLFAVGVNEKRAIFEKKYTDDLMWHLERSTANLAQLAKDASANGSRFVVVAIPVREQVYAAESIDRFPAYDSEAPDRVLAATLEKLNTPLLDLLHPFRDWKTSHRKRLYFETDPHFSAEGNRVSAEAVADFLTPFI